MTVSPPNNSRNPNDIQVQHATEESLNSKKSPAPSKSKRTAPPKDQLETNESLRTELARTQKKLANLQQGIQHDKEDRATKSSSAAAVAAEKATQPGIFTLLGEIFEAVGRFGSGFLNFVSFAFSAVKIIGKLLKKMGSTLVGKKYNTGLDWTQELTRLALDFTGIFIPPIGALGNVAANMYWDESRALGGLGNILSDTTKKSAIRDSIGITERILNPVGKAYEGAKSFITREVAKPSGGVIDYRPLGASMGGTNMIME